MNFNQKSTSELATVAVTVYVCSHHQNVKLMFAAFDKGVTYEEVMPQLVIDLSKKACILKRCHSFPTTSTLKDHLCALLDEQYDADDVTFGHWEQSTSYYNVL